VIVRYTPGQSPAPVPSLAGSRTRYRPLLVVRISSATHSLLRDGLIDSGADDTVFPESIALNLGLDLTNAPQLVINLAGRGILVCRYASVVLSITDGVSETYEWSATVGFVPVPLRNPLLGHAGFFDFFDVDFRRVTREAVIVPNAAFPGRRI
jgi:hypothetical protein